MGFAGGAISHKMAAESLRSRFLWVVSYNASVEPNLK